MSPHAQSGTPSDSSDVAGFGVAAGVAGSGSSEPAFAAAAPAAAPAAAAAPAPVSDVSVVR